MSHQTDIDDCPRFVTPSAEELVRFMRDEKGISFELVSEEEAERFLDEKNFFFKVKAFAKNYPKYEKGERAGHYIGLDFGHLVELSRLDKTLRALVLDLTLDIEHCLKVRIDSSAMRFGIDRYKLVDSFLLSVEEQVVEDQLALTDCDETRRRLLEVIDILSSAVDKSHREMMVAGNEAVKILGEVTLHRNPNHIVDSISAMSGSPYSSDLVQKYTSQRMPYWVLLELMTFGDVVRLYKACFSKDGHIAVDSHEKEIKKGINPFLHPSQRLRNAAAHSDCLLNNLAKRSTRSGAGSRVRKTLMDVYGMPEEIVAPVGRVTVAMDLAAVLITYAAIVPPGETRSSAVELISSTRNRMLLHSEWFATNGDIRAFLSYADRLFDIMSKTIERPSDH